MNLTENNNDEIRLCGQCGGNGTTSFQRKGKWTTENCKKCGGKGFFLKKSYSKPDHFEDGEILI